MRNGVFVLGGQSVSNHVLVEWARAYPLRSCPRGIERRAPICGGERPRRARARPPSVYMSCVRGVCLVAVVSCIVVGHGGSGHRERCAAAAVEVHF